MDNIMLFSKNTVKCNAFNYKIEDFVNKMSQLIIKDSKNNYVHYQKNYKMYVIMYKGNTYYAKFDDDKLSKYYLEELKNITNINRKIRKEKETKTSDIKVFSIKSIDTIKNKKKAIEDLISEDKENKTKIFFDTIYMIMDMCVGNRGPGHVVYRVLLLVVGLFGMIYSVSISNYTLIVPIIIMLLDGIGASMFIGDYDDEPIPFGYRGIIVTLLSLCISPLLLGYNIVKRLNEKIVLKEKIKLINRDIKDRKGLLNKETLETIESYLNDINHDIKVSEDKLVITASDFKELMRMISSLEDKIIAKEYSIDLYNVLVDSLEIKKIGFASKANKRYQEVLNELKDLTMNVSLELKRQEEEKRIKNTHYKLMTEVNSIKDEVKGSEEIVKTKIMKG